MSVTQAFDLLNRSIRGIREDKNRHEERMAQVEVDKIQYQDKINDPRLKLDRAKAAEQLKFVPVDFNFSLANKSMLEHENFNTYIKPKLDSLLPDEIEMKDDRLPYFKGTNRRAELPKWQADQLKSDVNTMIALSGLQNNKLDMEIRRNQDELATLESAKGDKLRINQKKIGEKKAAIEELTKNKNDPAKRAERLIAENMDINRSYKQILGSRKPNPKLLEALDDWRENNNEELKVLISSGSAKNTIQVPYHIKRPDGSVITRHEIVNKSMVSSLPHERGYADGIGIRGDYKAPSGKGKTGSELIELQRQDKIIDDYFTLKNVLASTESEEAKDRVIRKVLKEKGGKEKASRIEEMLKDAKPEEIKNWRKQLTGFDKYRRYKWFSDVADTEEKPEEGKKGKSVAPTDDNPQGLIFK